ncbi:hypothetical protein BC940DRAFT_111509 [Gongronella butleri]|nr:hypothetical protein BC940DRAFT_111509 [Gongronella butleri]
MTKKIIAVDLTFPEQAEFYGPRPNDKHSTYPKRQKLRGKLRLITSQPTTLSSVEIRFKGQTNLHWRDPLTHSLLASRIQGTRLIRKSKHALLQEATIPSGVTDLGFEVTIPGYVCPTYTTDFVSIKYTVAARIVPLGKFTKDIEIERPITVRKTLMPKDIAQGMITGYQVPQRPMHGQRPGYLAWEFKVPKWACLGASVAFVGALKPLQNNITIDRINVDVVQEELYHDDAGDQRRRHVTFCRNRPSTYLHPPVGSNIAFDFPLHNHGLLSSTTAASPGRKKRRSRRRTAPLSSWATSITRSSRPFCTLDTTCGS